MNFAESFVQPAAKKVLGNQKKKVRRESRMWAGDAHLQDGNGR